MNNLKEPHKILAVLCFGIAFIMSSHAFADVKSTIDKEIMDRQEADANLQTQITALQNEVNAGVYEIGDVLPDGSIVFWVNETGRHGMSAWPVDSVSSFDGNDLMNWHTAKEAAESHGPGWHAPTKHVLNLLHEKRNDVGGFADAAGGFPSGNYWSSTEYNDILAWYHDFFNGSQYTANKVGLARVRAVRSF